MIIYRYLSREIFFSTLAVALVLVPIIVSGRLINLLNKISPGEMDLVFIAELIGYRLPSMLMLILPLALFLGVLLAYGKLYLESEITVLKASGVSGKQLVAYALGPALGGALIVAIFSLYVSPISFKALEMSYAKRDAMSELDTLTAGRFQKLPGERTVYIGDFLENRSKLKTIFVSQLDKKTGKLEITYAQSGVQQNSEKGNRYLELQDGYRYTGIPGALEYDQLQYAQYGYLLPKRKLVIDSDEPEAKTIQYLLNSEDNDYIAELQWRLSLPLLAFIVVMIAVPLSKTNPRQGRYAQLIPTILLYLAYLSLLVAAKHKIQDGSSIGLIWIVHLVFFCYGLSLIIFEHFWTNLFNKLPSITSMIKGKK
ncbi:MAG: LPS export ABC transporter permease LptF [Oceanospirillaceae bacterium]